ncbi:MAG: tetratricopeptide repeat protein [Candidatus Omnitrophica bacterium]|nr:tetratricopeptide repeat protein [Candidatus Omnitrophota bacterium]
MKLTKHKGVQWIVLGLVMVMTAGCSSQYTMERKLWLANRAAEKVVRNEAVISPFEVNRVIRLFENIIAKAPDSSYAVTAQLRIGQLYEVRKSYDAAREIYAALETSSAGKVEIQAMARFRLAQTYEKEGNWAQALVVLQDVLKKYDKTGESLAVPLYIARYYHKNGDPANAKRAYAAAIEHFQSMADRFPKTKAALLCRNLVLRTYIEQSDWPGALDYIGALDKQYRLGPDTLMLQAKIYEQRLKNKPKAMETYQRIINDFPNTKVMEVARKNLEALNTKK